MSIFIQTNVFVPVEKRKKIAQLGFVPGSTSVVGQDGLIGYVVADGTVINEVDLQKEVNKFRPEDKDTDKDKAEKEIKNLKGKILNQNDYNSITEKLAIIAGLL